MINFSGPPTSLIQDTVLTLYIDTRIKKVTCSSRLLNVFFYSNSVTERVKHPTCSIQLFRNKQHFSLLI